MVSECGNLSTREKDIASRDIKNLLRNIVAMGVKLGL
jgi:hypothetical protein